MVAEQPGGHLDRAVDGVEAAWQHDPLVGGDRLDQRFPAPSGRQQLAGRLPAEIDPACLVVMLMAAAMAPTSLPQVIEGVCGADPRSPEFVGHFAEQVALLARHIGLQAPGS
ncbi:hypothetical protein OIE66_24630 [Nonomuraea sp. NBC_01738]|uniref:hypothetical protein n=1 Tax=Nonomuraea sp. NBC_01738 TaxID=2976003 RepID=UPI002E0F94DC|nr:hypothetical protein OIE66_24630 [Nonomuraea sp. NBC_01738]